MEGTYLRRSIRSQEDLYIESFQGEVWEDLLLEAIEEQRAAQSIVEDLRELQRIWPRRPAHFRLHAPAIGNM